jgi:poly(A) polymerase
MTEKTMGGLLRRLADLPGPDRWIVGGLLRDALLGRPLADADFAVNGDARSLAETFARQNGGSFFPLDEERGTHRAVVGPLVFDFSRLQGRDLAADLGQRDLTINALALPAAAWGTPGWEKHIVDLHEGRRDLKAGRLRFVGPRVVVGDPLRLLRLFRFAAELDFKATPAALALVRRHRKLLIRSAPERVREELLKTLSTPRAAPALSAMDKAGLLDVLFPEVVPMRRTGRDYYGAGGVLAHSIAAVASLEKLWEELPRQFPAFHKPLRAHLGEPFAGHPRFAHLKLVELFHDVGKPATAKKEGGEWHFYGHDAVGARIVAALSKRLRLSSEEGRSLSRQVGAHMRPGNLGHQPVLTDRAVYRFYRDLEESAVGLLIVSLADHFTYLSPRARLSRKDPVFRTIHKMLGGYFRRRDKVEPPRLLDGHTLMRALRLRPGPEVGRLLSLIREAQAAGEVKTLQDALRLAKSEVQAK